MYQQTQRWIAAGCFEVIVHEQRVLMRIVGGRAPEPTAAIFDSRTLQSTPESGTRAGWAGAKRHKGSKVHLAVDPLGHPLVLIVTPANAQDRDQIAELAAVQEETDDRIEVVYVDQGYIGEAAEQAADGWGIRLEVVKLPVAKRGFVRLPRRWVVERPQGWAARFPRLARDYERLPETLAGLHLVAFVSLMVQRVASFLAQRS